MRVCGLSTEAGNDIIAPAGNAPTSPKAIRTATGDDVRDAARSKTAAINVLIVITKPLLPTRSAVNPPSGTMKIVNQRTRLTIDPLAVIVQPCSTITFIPNEKIIATEALNKPQIKPAMATRRIVGPAMREDSRVKLSKARSL